MPYVTTIERAGIERGRVEGRAEGHEEGARTQVLRDIETGLRCKFRDDGLALMPRIRQITDLGRLQSILETLWTAGSPAELPLDSRD